MPMSLSSRGLLIGLGALAVVYALALLEFVAISPDLRIRAFLVDASPIDEDPGDGLIVQATPGLDWQPGQSPPQPGDMLLNVNGHPTPTLLDYFRAIDELYLVTDQQFEKVKESERPQDWSPLKIRGLALVMGEQGPTRRLVEVLYRAAGPQGRVEQAWIEIQSPPPGGLLLSILWLIPHLAILFVGGAACWQRPFDRSARIFFLMCIVTMVAYMGGFHWWTVANSAWLTWPFIACGVILPAVTLHFFLIYPRPARWTIRYRRWLIVILYAIPVAASLGAAVFLVLLHRTPMIDGVIDPAVVREKIALLSVLRDTINALLVVAAIYYLLTLAVLVRTVLTVHDPIERAQLRWILGAAILATLPVGYTLYLAATDRAAFAFGGAKYPMFIASFGFLFAYAAGMVKHRLLLVDEVIGKGPRYYVARAGLTVVVAVALAGLGLWAGAWGAWLPRPQSTAAVTAVIILAAFVLLFARDRLQQALDRRFFSEKYQLGAALRVVHAGTGPAATETELGQRVIDSCQQALDTARLAVYRRNDARSNLFHLSAASGAFPEELRLETAVVEFIEAGGSVQRVLGGSRADRSPRQDLLRALSCQLLYAPPAGEGASTLLVLGPKQDEATYTAEDMAFLSALGHVADIAFAGAGTHQRMVEQLRLAEETIASSARQITVLQGELGDLYQRQDGVAQSDREPDFRREIIRGESAAINDVLEMVRKVAASDATVMIRGESGTGKELLAQVIHDNSQRPGGPLVRVHCAALSPTLLESELFGHVKGAFTGADRDKIGRFELASGGTLFLDEIGEISPETQVKLLRVMQERCFEPVGSSKTIEVDVRIITATNRNLEDMIADGDFREDLYYRLNVISVTLPPLRERKGDVVDLSFTFLHRAARRMDKPLSRIDDDALALLEQYSWPGNVRELQNVIERAVVLGEGHSITLQDLPAEIRGGRPRPKSRPARAGTTREEPLRRIVHRPAKSRPDEDSRLVNRATDETDERQELVEALEQTGGNKARAARLLGLPRSTFFSKLKKYNLA